MYVILKGNKRLGGQLTKEIIFNLSIERESPSHVSNQQALSAKTKTGVNACKLHY